MGGPDGDDHQVRLQPALVRHHCLDGVGAFDGLHLFVEEKADSVFFHLPLGHAGELRPHESGHDLTEIFHDRGIHLPHVGQGFGHFKPDKTAADDNGTLHLTFGDQLLDPLGIVQVGGGMNHGKVGAGDDQPPGTAAGSQYQLVIGQGVGGAVRSTDMQLFVLPVDSLRTGLGEHLDILAIPKKGLVPQHVETRFAQVVDIADIAGDIKGDTASAVGDKSVLIDDGDAGARFQTFKSAGRLRSKGNAADDDDVLGHVEPLV